MDYILEILIPKKIIDKSNIVEVLVEWGGVVYSQEPKQYTFQNILFFQEYTNKSNIKDIVGDILDINDYTSLILEKDSFILLSKLEFIVNKKKCTIDENIVISLFYELYNSLDKFCIIKELDDEAIDGRYIINNVHEAIDIFVSSLNWDSPKGIVIIKK